MKLALDLGTKTGWALGQVEKAQGGQERSEKLKSGMMNFNSHRLEGAGQKYLSFKKWLEELHRNRSLEEVVFEAVNGHKGTFAAHAYGGFVALLMSFCEEKHIPYYGLSVGTIKKYITGKGNASKEEVIKAIQARGYSPKDDNEADALATYFCSEGLYGSEAIEDGEAQS